jgi:hypothetical protein
MKYRVKLCIVCKNRTYVSSYEYYFFIKKELLGDETYYSIKLKDSTGTVGRYIVFRTYSRARECYVENLKYDYMVVHISSPGGKTLRDLKKGIWASHLSRTLIC